MPSRIEAVRFEGMVFRIGGIATDPIASVDKTVSAIERDTDGVVVVFQDATRLLLLNCPIQAHEILIPETVNEKAQDAPKAMQAQPSEGQGQAKAGTRKRPDEHGPGISRRRAGLPTAAPDTSRATQGA